MLATLPYTHSGFYKWKPLQANRVLKAFERVTGKFLSRLLQTELCSCVPEGSPLNF